MERPREEMYRSDESRSQVSWMGLSGDGEISTNTPYSTVCAGSTDKDRGLEFWGKFRIAMYFCCNFLQQDTYTFLSLRFLLRQLAQTSKLIMWVREGGLLSTSVCFLYDKSYFSFPSSPLTRFFFSQLFGICLFL